MDIAVIDISPLVNGGEVTEVVKKLKTACEGLSCFYITGHGIDESLMTNVMEKGREFFQLSTEIKNAISLKNSRAFRGYIQQGSEKTADKVDVKEGIYFGPDISSESPDVLAGNSMMGPNQFPDESHVPGFAQVLKEFMNKMATVGHALINALALGLQLDNEFIRGKFNSAFFLQALWHYPPVPKNSESWGVGPHTDYGALTLLMQDDAGGLQVETTDGEWIDISPMSGTFVVNIGDVLETWSKGKLRATVHRVKSSASKHRISAPFFYQPALDCVIESLDDIKLAHVQSTLGLDIPFTFGEYMCRKFKKSYGAN